MVEDPIQPNQQFQLTGFNSPKAIIIYVQEMYIWDWAWGDVGEHEYLRYTVKLQWLNTGGLFTVADSLGFCFFT